MNIEKYFEEAKGSEPEESVQDLAKFDKEDLLQLCIDKACGGCCDSKERKAYFVKAVSMILEELGYE